MARKKAIQQGIPDLFADFGDASFGKKEVLAEEPPKVQFPDSEDGKYPELPDAPVYTVSGISELIQTVLSQTFSRVYVEGEISGGKLYPSGHYYFTLKDEGTQIGGVMFRYDFGRLDFRPEDGMQVMVQARASIYNGKCQLVCSKMEPCGLGARQLQLEQLKKKLAAEGLFDEERKRKLPSFPKTIAFVTSPAGAVIRDVKNVLFRRFPCRLILVPCQVQGEGAAKTIVEGIENANRYSAEHPENPIDILIVGRGGGSMEDLWCFNDEAVARAIAASNIPTISAVGHETDFTVADLVADLRAPTPSAAAEICVRPIREWRQKAGDAKEALDTAMDGLLSFYGQRLLAYLNHRALQRPVTMVDRLSQELDQKLEKLERGTLALISEKGQKLPVLAERLGSAAVKRLEALEGRLKTSFATLEALGPMAVLKRGYAFVQSLDGKVVSTKAELLKAHDFTLRLLDGSVKAQVSDTE